jgi:hypothetical protein
MNFLDLSTQSVTFQLWPAKMPRFLLVHLNFLRSLLIYRYTDHVQKYMNFQLVVHYASICSPAGVERRD